MGLSVLCLFNFDEPVRHNTQLSLTTIPLRCLTDSSTWVGVNMPRKVLLQLSSFFPSRTVNTGLSVLTALLPTNLDPFLAQEVGGGVQHVGGVGGVVVGVGRVVAALHQLQPRAQRCLRAVEELAHAEAGEDLQAEVSQRPAGGDARNRQMRALHVHFLQDFT